MIYLYLAIAMIVGYLLGSINFARIFSWHLEKKDITEMGSKNPGTMNMLRTQGFGRAMLTLAFEAIKIGVPALACFFIFKHFFVGYEHLAYYLSAFAGIIGHCFPIFYKFKGGKGVACAFGMYLFHPNFWWVSLIAFAICFILFFFIQYAFIISFIFIFGMAIYATCYLIILYPVAMNIPVIVILWLIWILIVFLHRGNIKRLIEGKENKVNFKEKVFEKKHKKNKEQVVEENLKEEKQEDVAVEEKKEEVSKEENVEDKKEES